MSFAKRLLVPWLLLPVALVVAACGGDDPTATPVPTATTPSAAEPTFDEQWAALIEAARAGKLVIDASRSCAPGF